MYVLTLNTLEVIEGTNIATCFAVSSKVLSDPTSL